MKLIRALVLTSVLVPSVVCFGYAGTTVSVPAVSKSFLIKYKSGQVELRRVTWTAVYEWEWHETGSPSTITHPIDDRRCHWVNRGLIQRTEYLVSPAGDTYAGPTNLIFDGGLFQNEGGFPGDIGNCVATEARRNSDNENTRAVLAARFSADVARDVEAYRKDKATNPIVIEVKEQ